MIWYDMSYNQFEADFINRLETEPEENEEEEVVNEFNQANTTVFNSNGCIL